MSDLAQHTFSEIQSQPVLWEQTITAFEQQIEPVLELCRTFAPDKIILTGCGSTYYLSLMGSWLLQRATGIPAVAYPAAEIMMFPDLYLTGDNDTLLITVSRSGVTRETITAAQLFRQKEQGKTMTITCHSESPLAQEADAVLSIDAAREESPVQTRSFTSMTLMLQLLAKAWGENNAATLKKLPPLARQLLQQTESLASELGAASQYEKFVFLGSGLLYGLACEAMLKTAEMVLVPAVAFHALEFRHGPRYAVDDKTLVVALLNDETYDEDIHALADAKHFGATVVAMVDDAAGGVPSADHVIQLKSGLGVEDRLLLYLPFIQLLGAKQAVTRGYDPDRLRERAPK